MIPHRHADLLRVAADDRDARFECDNLPNHTYTISTVTVYASYDWRVAKPPKKMVTRYLWANSENEVDCTLRTEDEVSEFNIGAVTPYTIKLEWSKTEMEES
ncbi:hypothetical protein PIGBHMHK_00657 [Mycoplasmopsis arginini]|nr:hypothetical protein [Mycoplasmopsis arginini]